MYMLMAIIGISGKMGTQLYEYFKDKFEIVGIDIINFPNVQTFKSLKDVNKKIDVVVDFSSIKAYDELKYAIDNKIITLSGTTGYSDEEIDNLFKIGGNLFYWSSNYAKGINLFTRLIKLIKKEYSLFDFIEIHALTKKDSPSGTAKMLARELDIPYEKIQSIRMHYAPPIHELIFSSKNEQITIRHEVTNAIAFLEGFENKLNEMIGVG